MGMSVRSYAASRGADPKAIRQAIQAGVILRDADGTIDPVQADELLVGPRPPRLAWHRQSERRRRRRSAQAKVDLAAAKLRLLQQRHDELADRYVVRSEAIAQGEREAVYVLDGLRAAPAAYAATLAEEMDIPPETARRILERFTAAVLIEIGDLTRQAIRDAERA